MLLTGAEILLECLTEQNVGVIFGYPGGAVLPVYDALYHYRHRIKHILTSHEQGAAHAADGYARSTGRVGVCLATSGPGATNLVTGIAAAYMDSSPVVAITGNVALPLLGKDSFQEVDIAGITMPVTKHNYIVKDVRKLAETVRAAFNVARSGRPGPVLIDILKDVTEQRAGYKYAPPLPAEVTANFTAGDIERAVCLIDRAERPVILSGGGVIAAGAAGKLKSFAERIGAPVCVTVMGIGGFPASHDLYGGMAGIHGTESAAELINGCDLLIAVGARFSDRVTGETGKFAPNAKLLHIDADAAEINKNAAADCYINGDAFAVLERLTEAVGVKPRRMFYTKNDTPDESSFPLKIINLISQNANEYIIVTEVGQHQMLACRRYRAVLPRRFITSGGLGAMGFGLPAAIGAAVANPGTTVINLAGDGCFGMNNIELATAVENSLPVITVIFNNRSLGMVRQWQGLFYSGRFSQTDLSGKKTDFVKLAEAYGADAYKAATYEDFYKAFTKAAGKKRPAVIDCEMAPDAMDYRFSGQ